MSTTTTPKKKSKAMEFCPKCEDLLRPEKDDDGKIVLKCDSCGFKRPIQGEDDLEGYRRKEVIKHTPKDHLLIMDEEYYNKKMPTSSVTDFKCRRCGYEKCSLVTMQTRRADEGMTHFLICGRCGYKLKIGS